SAPWGTAGSRSGAWRWPSSRTRTRSSGTPTQRFCSRQSPRSARWCCRCSATRSEPSARRCAAIPCGPTIPTRDTSLRSCASHRGGWPRPRRCSTPWSRATRPTGGPPHCWNRCERRGAGRGREPPAGGQARYRSHTNVEFDLQPRLKGDLIELRPLRPSDFDALLEAASDPLIWEQHPEPDRYQREVFRRYFESAIESGGAFAIVERKNGRISGSSRYCNVDPAGREVAIGWTSL